MRNFLLRLFVNALALSAAGWLVDGVNLSEDFVQVLMVALVFGLINAILKPILKLLSFPLLFLSLGLFSIVINAALLLLTARLVEGFSVDGFMSAILGSLVISIVGMFLNGALKDEKKKK